VDTSEEAKPKKRTYRRKTAPQEETVEETPVAVLQAEDDTEEIAQANAAMEDEETEGNAVSDTEDEVEEVRAFDEGDGDEGDYDEDEEVDDVRAEGNYQDAEDYEDYDEEGLEDPVLAQQEDEDYTEELLDDEDLPEAARLTHLDPDGRAQMVDISAKPVTSRTAVATSYIKMSKRTLDLLERQDLPKGDALTVAEVAGIMGAKRTSDLIPLCHPIPLTNVTVRCEVTPSGVLIRAEASTNAQTGVEMEALTAASIAGLTLYDMCKGVDQNIVVADVRLNSKTGGLSGDWQAQTPSDEVPAAAAAVAADEDVELDELDLEEEEEQIVPRSIPQPEVPRTGGYRRDSWSGSTQSRPPARPYDRGTTGGYQGNRPSYGGSNYNRDRGTSGGYQGNRPSGGYNRDQGSSGYNRDRGTTGSGYQGNRPSTPRPGGYQGNRDAGTGYNRDRDAGSSYNRDRGTTGYNRDRGTTGGYQGNRPSGPRPGGYQGRDAGSSYNRDRDAGSNYNRDRGTTGYNRDQGTSNYNRDRGTSNYGKPGFAGFRDRNRERERDTE
jgi:cyclic pyranopterin phosphate synthase